MASQRPSRLEAELREFLERLGRSVESPRGGQLVAKHRTALVEEETRFKIIDSIRDRPLVTAVNILASHVPMPPPGGRAACFYLSDFLDRTIQGTRIAEDIQLDPDVCRQRTDFIPQHLASEGEVLPRDSVDYFFDEWLPEEDQRLLVVLAPAGYGKTVLTCELAHEMAARYIEGRPGRRPPFPFLIPFSQFRRLASFEAMVLSSLQRKGVTDYTAGAFAQLVKQQRVVLMLDGFDELLEERPDEARKNLRELIETLEGRGKVVVTARSTFFRTSEDVSDFLEYYLGSEQVRVIEIQPFDHEQRRKYVAKQLGDGEAAAKALELIETPTLKEAMGSPLLLRETMQALRAGEQSLGAGAGRAELFDTLETSVYERERQRHNHRFADKEQRDFLEALGKEMLVGNTRGFDWEAIQVVALECVDDAAAPESELGRLADHHFLTVRTDSREVQFNHQVFREYFQARSLVSAATDSAASWVVAMLSQRPVPEEVCVFLAELDSQFALAELLLGGASLATRPSDRLANNIGSVMAAYRHSELVRRFLAETPRDLPLTLRLTGLDLRRSIWSGRYLQGMEFVDCLLDEADFSGANVSDVTLRSTSLKDANFRGAKLDSLMVDRGERVFGTLEVLRALRDLGAETGIEQEGVRKDAEATRRDEILALVQGRIRRFYVPGTSDTHDSRWDSSIQERNLFGGMRQIDARFIKSKVIPRMLSLGILERSRLHGIVIYHLTNEAEDDARILMETGEACGVFGELLDRLSGRAATPASG